MLNNLKIDTKIILTVITLCELFVDHDMLLSVGLWCGYGLYKFFDNLNKD